MRLSIECNGFKATLTSGSNLAPPNPSKKEKALNMKKERSETAAIDGRNSKNPMENIDKPIKQTKVLSYYFNNKEEEEEEEELITRSSSQSFYSISNSSMYYRIKNKSEKKKAPTVNVGRGVAVVEHSSDPYGDFRRSMVEMIMARKKLTAGDLSNLLRCYLSLNHPQNHPVILKAFSDIYMGSSVQH